MLLGSGYRDIWKLAYPLMLGNIAANLVNFINTAFLGRVGEVELAAAALAGVFYFSLTMIATAFGVGVQIIIARKCGEGKVETTGPYAMQYFYLNAILAGLMFIVLMYVSPLVFHRIVTEAPVYDQCIIYLFYRSPGIFFSLFAAVFRSFYTGIGRTKVVTGGILIIALVSMIFDYLLILGRMGFPQMGVQGAAISSVIAEGSGLLFYCLYGMGNTYMRKMNLFKIVSIDRSFIKDLLRLSWPMVFQYILSLGAWFLFFVVIESIGHRELAVSNILRSLYMLLMTPIWGYAAATPIVVSNLLGQERQAEIKSALLRFCMISGVSSMVMVLGLYAAPGFILRLFTNDPALQQASFQVLPVLYISLFLFSQAAIIISALSGIGNTRAALIVEMIAICTYLLYLFGARAKQGSLSLIWADEILYWILTGLLALFFLRRHHLMDGNLKAIK